MSATLLFRRLSFLTLTFVLTSCGIGICLSPGECGVRASLTVTGQGANFGQRLFGGTYTLALQISNNGSAAADGIAPSQLSAPFSYLGGSYPGTGGTCGETLAPGASCSVILTFAAPAPPSSNFSQTLRLTFWDGLTEVTAEIPVVARNDNGSFIQDAGFNGQVSKLHRTNEGLYAVGPFYAAKGTPGSFVARLHEDPFGGDAGFDPGASFNTFPFGVVGAGDGSGDIYVAGSFTSYQGTTQNRIARLKSDGSLRTSFASGTGFNSTVSNLFAAPDGSGDVYVGASSTYNGTPVDSLVRIRSDGSLDPGFVTPGTGFNGGVSSVAFLADGTLYASGGFSAFNGTTRARMARLFSDGSLDTAFNPQGTGFSGGSTVSVVLPADDGTSDVYAGGDFGMFNSVAKQGLVRLTSSGNLQPSFNTGVGFNGSVNALLLDPDGSGDLYVAGSFTTYQGTAVTRVVRLNSDGSLDTGFQILKGPNGIANALLAGPPGSNDIYVAGTFFSYSNTGAVGMVRVDSTNEIVSGYPIQSGFAAINSVESLTTMEDGSLDIVAGGGFNSYNGTLSTRLIRLTSHGVMNTSSLAVDSWVHSTATAPNTGGKYYLAGEFGSYGGSASNYLVRVNSDGSYDPSFNSAGLDDYATLVQPLVDGSGKMYVVGEFIFVGATVTDGLIRLNANGSADGTFGSLSAFNSRVTSVAQADDGSGDVYVWGGFTAHGATPRSGFLRLNADGTLDTAFAPAGTGLGTGLVTSVLPVKDGSGDIWVGGNFTTYNGTSVGKLVRLRSDGSLNASFSLSEPLNGAVGTMVYAPDSSGDLYVAGSFSGKLVRLQTDGKRSPSFQPGTGFDGAVLTIAPARDGTGDIYVGGAFSHYNGAMHTLLARLSSIGEAE